MTLNEIINNLHTANLNEDELIQLNKAVIGEIKFRRSQEASRKRFMFKAGDKVSFNGRRGYTEGTVVRVKRKKAIISVDGFGRWDVPLNMLTAA